MCATLFLPAMIDGLFGQIADLKKLLMSQNKQQFTLNDVSLPQKFSKCEPPILDDDGDEEEL
jgi:hypothetical protein